ncbi:hypothetical protein [Aneurinibacillus aneurinilyticus]|uniref:hypothetical protein n=1 Tax=Aneurinibacillus aneurinilyticus TaxID=1391 RepID=UPI0023EFF22A|nr:hypothetical protein [Aneurinibacillus aneurinilyticus]
MAYDLIARLKLVDNLSQPIRRVLGGMVGMRKETDAVSKALHQTNSEQLLFRDINRSMRDDMAKFSSESRNTGGTIEKLGGIFRGTTGSMKGFSGGIGGLHTSILGLAGSYVALDTAAKTVKGSLSGAIALESEQMKMEALMGNTLKAKKFITDLQTMAIDSPVSGFKEFLSGSNVFLTFTKEEDKLKRLLLLSERLRELNPEENFGGAVYATAEALSGDYQSIKERFRISGTEAKKFSNGGKGMPLDQAMDYLDYLLNKRGITSGYIEQKETTTEAKINKIKEQWDMLLTSAGTPALDSIKPSLDRISAMFAEGKLKGFQNFLTSTVEKGAQNFERLVVATDKFLTRIQTGDLKGLGFGDTLIKVTEEGMDALNRWLANGGSDKIASAVKPIAETAIGVGVAIGKGILDGFVEFAKDNPWSAALITTLGAMKVASGPLWLAAGAAGSAIGGFLVTAAAAAITAGLSYAVIKALDDAEERAEKRKYLLDTPLGRGYNKELETPDDQPMYPSGNMTPYEPSTWEKTKNWFSNAFSNYNGIDSVPYDGYKAILHKGEKVVPSTEVRKEDKPNVNININNMVVREEADINRIALALAYEIKAARGNMAT